MNSKIKDGDLVNLLFLFAVAAVFTLFVFIHLWRNIQFANLSYDIEILTKEKKKLFMEVEGLRLSMANYSNIIRVEKIFREELGYLPLEIGKRIVTLELPSLNLSREVKEESQINLLEPVIKPDITPENLSEEDNTNQ
ncbi:MAG: hypothetical protein ABUK01_02350 [Leptospirales bacterium]